MNINTQNFGNLAFNTQIIDSTDLSSELSNINDEIKQLSVDTTLSIPYQEPYEEKISIINGKVWITGARKFHNAGKRTPLLPITRENCKFKITTQCADQAAAWVLFTTDIEDVEHLSANQATFLQNATGKDTLINGEIIDFTAYFDEFPELKSVMFNYYPNYQDKELTFEILQLHPAKYYNSINEIYTGLKNQISSLSSETEQKISSLSSETEQKISSLSSKTEQKIDLRTKTFCGKYGVEGEYEDFKINIPGVYLHDGRDNSNGYHSPLFEVNPNKCIFEVTTSVRDSVRIATFFDKDMNVVPASNIYINDTDEFIGQNVNCNAISCTFTRHYELYPQVKYVRFNLYPMVDSPIENPYIRIISIIDENTVLSDSIYYLSNMIDYKIQEAGDKSNILFNKSYVTVGDSYTQYGSLPNQTYPHFIAERNSMNLTNIAKSGSITFLPSNYESTEMSSRYNYSKHISAIYNTAVTADYMTFALGCNDVNDVSAMGISSDSDDSTYFGAWNTILSATLSANPAIKLGIIINDGYITLKQNVHDTLIKVAEYWGIPYLDLCNDPQVPLMLMLGGERKHKLNPYAVKQRLEALYAYDSALSSGQKDHPGLEGQKYRSTIIENFLRSL